MREHFDLVVIGGGPAGETGATYAAHLGKRVCLIERAPKPGGASVNTGTIPSKALRETALSFSGLRRRGPSGVDLRVKQGITIADFMVREREVIEASWRSIEARLQQHGVVQVQGTAGFVDANTVEVTRYGQPSRLIGGETFLLATGSRPQPPVGVEIDGHTIVDSDSLLTLQHIPRTMIVVGGGVVGCEYACTFAALGVRVALVTTRPRLLAHLDAEIADEIRVHMTSRLGIQLHLDTDVRSMASVNGLARLRLGEDTELMADCLLYSAGRLGNSEELGLGRIGIRTDVRGFVRVNEHFRTTTENVYAAGDLIGYPALASVSMEQARIAISDACGVRHEGPAPGTIPYAVWTIPEIATAGQSPEQLAARGVDHDVAHGYFRDTAQGRITGETDGFVKLTFDPANGRILGVGIIGEDAAELVHIATMVMTTGGTLQQLVRAVYTHPSLAETFQLAARAGLEVMARRHAEREGLPSGPYRTIPA